MCRDGLRKAKAHLELNLTSSAKNNKKGFCRYVTQTGEVKESVHTYTAMGNARLADR